MLELNRFPGSQPLSFSPGDEFIQQRRIGPLGVLRLPAFMAQVLQEILNQSLHWRLNLPGRRTDARQKAAKGHKDFDRKRSEEKSKENWGWLAEQGLTSA
jgi:hypothetical protein